MKEFKKRPIACLLLLITALMPYSTAYANSNFYTYNYDYYGIELESPDAYTAEDMLIGSMLGEEVGDFLGPSGLFVRDELIYIVDTGNNRIVVVDKSFKLVRIIKSVVIDGEESFFNQPTDVFVDRNGDLYICDKLNQRVIHTDKDLNLIKLYTKPTDETILEKSDFLPIKCVVDTSGRLFLMAGNVNKGFMQFEKDGSFSVYVGANPVKATLFQVIKKRLMTKEQRERMILFVPTEYSNIAIDKDNFLYATTATFSDGELENNPSKVNPIRKLNSLGTDILIRNGYWYPIGDLYWGSGGDVSGASRFEDITALDNDIYMAVDRVRGRIFAYDFQGNLLYAFGGLGNKMGYFEYPSAIEHMGTDILVLDYKSGSLTRFTLTEFGDYINKALALYKEGKYDESAEYWEKVIHLNGNYDLAYIGIGRALLRKGEFAEAMKYFRSKIDRQNYSKAFQQYRKVWVEENISYLIGGFIFLLILPKVVRLIKKLIKGGAARNEH